MKSKDMEDLKAFKKFTMKILSFPDFPIRKSKSKQGKL